MQLTQRAWWAWSKLSALQIHMRLTVNRMQPYVTFELNYVSRLRIQKAQFPWWLEKNYYWPSIDLMDLWYRTSQLLALSFSVRMVVDCCRLRKYKYIRITFVYVGTLELHVWECVFLISVIGIDCSQWKVCVNVCVIYQWRRSDFAL